MALNQTLCRADGSEFGAYLARPRGKARGAVVVVQEIFGVNPHIRAVTDRFAAEGYTAIAPSLFDRHTPGLELDYTPAGAGRGREIKNGLRTEDCLEDIRVATEAVRDHGRVAIVGFCWGGFLAWQGAARIDGLSAAVGYYGGGIARQAAQLENRVPVMLHFGREDSAIPLDEVTRFMSQRPDIEVHLYDAGHGFNCDQRDAYHAVSAERAWDRTQRFLSRLLAE